MIVNVLTEIVIQRDLTIVAQFAANPNNAPAWYVNIKGVEWKTIPQLQIGSQIAFVADFLGKRLAYTYEIIEYEECKTLVMRTAEGPFPMETTYTWEAVSKSATRMTLRNKGNPAGFSRLFSPFMIWAMKRANQNDLKKLKSILES